MFLFICFTENIKKWKILQLCIILKLLKCFVQLDISILTCVHAYISFLYPKHFPILYSAMLPSKSYDKNH